MADTIVNTPPASPPASNDSSGGWAVAVIILLAVIVGGFVWYHYRAPAPREGSTNINVTLPADTTGGNPAQ